MLLRNRTEVADALAGHGQIHVEPFVLPGELLARFFDRLLDSNVRRCSQRVRRFGERLRHLNRMLLSECFSLVSFFIDGMQAHSEINRNCFRAWWLVAPDIIRD